MGGCSLSTAERPVRYWDVVVSIVGEQASKQYADFRAQAHKLASEIAAGVVLRIHEDRENLLDPSYWREHISDFVISDFVHSAAAVPRHPSRPARVYTVVGSMTAYRGWAGEQGDAAGVAVAKPTVSATGQVSKSTLLTQFAALPCGQRYAVILIFLCALAALDLPQDVRDYIAYLIGVFSAALWLVSKVSKN
jgi:hypothetical protein